MRSRLRVGALVFGLSAALVATLHAGPAYAKQPDPSDGDKVEVYAGTVNAEQFEELRKVGVDAQDITKETDGSATKVETVLTERQAARLAAKGVKLAIKRIGGKTSSQVLREQQAAGWDAYRSYSEPGGIRDEINAVAAQYPMLTKVVEIGRTVQDKPILAVKVTRNAKQVADGSRPSTAYVSAQHAREWITVEMTRRLLHHVLDNYGKDPAITTLVNRTELWFVPVANPDGYDYTFTPDNRLWRKNLADNNGDDQITAGDGVDPNRNFSYKWGWDNEGSSPDPFSETYRGPAANSEPETEALDNLFERIGFEFFINYHSAAELLLYGVGWQVSTPTPDDEIYKAMVGDDADPAVPGYDPDISAELYTTNGDTDTHMTVRYGTLGFTPEMTTCQTVSASDPDDEWEPEACVSGFNFPDDEELIQAEFVKNIPFALAVGRSALDPDDPVSVVGQSTPDFVIDPFDVSYGTRQPVATIARRALGDVRMHYTVNGGQAHSVSVEEWQGGERYGNTHDDYYAELRGTVTGTEAGDEVEVWFSGRKRGTGQVTSEHFTYQVHDDIGGDVLILAVEDVTGISPGQPGFTSAKYADEMAAAITAAGRTSDVYDFDTQGRKAPHHLGVLSHYEAVLWETGDDIILRAQGQVGGTTMKAALDIELSVRDYLNEGGKVLVSGKYAQFAQAANGAYFYNPFTPPECTTPNVYPVPAGAERFPAVLAGRPQLHRRWRHHGRRHLSTDRDRRPVHRVGRHARRQPEPHRVLPADVELPAAGGVPVVRAKLGAGRLGPAGRRAFRAAHRRLASIQWQGRRVVQAADPHSRPHRCHHRAASVLHLIRDGVGLGLPVRRGARGRHRHVDHVAGRQRQHRHRHRPELPGGLVRVASLPHPLPGRGLLAHRDHRHMERGDGDLGRLRGVGHRPDPVRRQAGRAVDQLCLRLGFSGSRGVPRRRVDLHQRRCPH